MAQRQRTGLVARERGASSGVYPALSPERLAEHGAEDLSGQALVELDTGHETREHRVYEELFDAAPDAYLVTDELGVIIQANRKAHSLFNLEARFLVGKPLVSLLQREDRERFHELLGSMKDATIRLQARVKPYNEDRSVWTDVRAQRGVRDESSICIRWLLRDIDRDKREELQRSATEEQLRRRIRELEASNRALGNLLEREQLARRDADERLRTKERILFEVAHELRSPLGSMANWLHILEPNTEAGTLRGRALASISRSLHALLRITENLVEHARVENHAVAPEVTSLDLVATLREVLDDLEPLAQLKQLHIELLAHSPDVPVSADRWLLHQVFRNLVGNAIKFTPERGTVQVGVAASAAHAEVTIHDSGRGIPAAALDKIFTPFFQADHRRTDDGGLGLGLSIAHRLIELHGGTIEAESDGPGCGSTFRVRLPRPKPSS